MEITIAVLLLAVAVFLGGDTVAKVLAGVAGVLALVQLIRQAR